MPYIAIKTYPKDEKVKKNLVDKINQLIMDEIGCPQKAITISLEEVTPEEWDEKVIKPEIEPKMDKVMILSGEKRY